jgi:ribonuclease HI
MWERGKQARTLSVKLGSTAEYTVYEAEVVSILLVLPIAGQLVDSDLVLIGVDNQVAIKAVQGMESTPVHFLLDEIRKVAKELRKTQPGFKLPLSWVPGDRGVPGNETMDALAKEAAEGRGSRAELLPAMLQKTLPLCVSATSAE